MADLFLIKGETLKVTADTIREYLDSDIENYSFISEVDGGNGEIIENSVMVYYQEFIDDDGSGYNGIDPGLNHGDTFVAYSFLENDEGKVVPVLYKTDLINEDDGSPLYEDPDTEEPFFYEGTAELYGVIYDKWRKIELGGVGSIYTWEADAKQYIYTNIIVQANQINPTEFPSKITEVREAGYNKGYTHGYDSGLEVGGAMGYEEGHIDGINFVKTSEAKSSADLVANGVTVTVPSGYYAEDAEKSVPTIAQASPSITVETSTGIVKASVTQPGGCVEGGTKTSTKQLTTQVAKTVTPKAYEQTILPAGVYTTGNIKVTGDSNLYASNIRKGAQIFGVTGTFDNYELGRRHFIPDYVQDHNELSLTGSDYGIGYGGYALSCFNGTYRGDHDSFEYAYTDFINYSVSDSENFEITITNKHHSLPVYVYVDVFYRSHYDDVSETYRKAIRVPPEGEVSYEFQNEYQSPDFEWDYAIRGLHFTSVG